MSAHDFRGEEPLWVKYAELISDEHNKYYEVRIDLADDGQFVLTKRWGRRPDRGVGQLKTEPYPTLTHAQNNADAALGGKIRKGYRVADRPHTASGMVVRETDYYHDSDQEAF
jgi:predicted DNA-binding WGR domain protein